MKRWILLASIALLALGCAKRGEDYSVTGLMKKFEHGDAAARFDAISGLKGHGVEAKPALPLLTTALKDADRNVRVNAISAGPLKTLAGSAVKGISAARDLMEAKAPLRRNITQEEVGNVAVFLASDWSRAVTGATIFADNGFNILGVTE